MSKPLYTLCNREGVLGLLWENNNLGKVLVLYNGEIDFNCDWSIRNCDYNKNEDDINIDLREFLYDIFPCNKIKKEFINWDEWLERKYKEIDEKFAQIIIKKPHPSEYLSSYNEDEWFIDDFIYSLED